MRAKVRLKIAFVVHHYNKHHGHSRYVAELAERFMRDHEVHVFTHRVDVAAPPAISFHHIPAWDWKALTSILSFIVPATVLVSGRFDIIHAQGLCGLRQNVTTAHMCQASWFDALQRIQGRLTLLQTITRTLVAPLERLTYDLWLSPEVIAISNTNRIDLKRYYRRSRNVEVIYHGVDLERFHPGRRETERTSLRATLGLHQDELVALYVGDFRKGAEPSLRALALIPELRLVLVSPTRPDVWRELADRLHIDDRVVFCPASKEIEQFYAAADIFLFPTFHDAFGLVITEAMAMGLPVVTSRNVGAAELIEDGVDGWLLDDPWDAEEVAGALRRLVNDPILRADMGQAARKKVEHFTWDRTAEETLKVYQKLVARSGLHRCTA